MATVSTNPLVNGLSGMLGRTIVFRQLRGKTIMANTPAPPSKQSEQQKVNRNKFKEATHWAKRILLDAERKEYYQKKAKKLKLPNAYTAAITDYMRKPKQMKFTNHDKSTTCTVIKKDFTLKAVSVTMHDANGETTETRVLDKNKYGEWSFKVSEAERLNGVEVRITDEAGKVLDLRLE